MKPVDRINARFDRPYDAGAASRGRRSIATGRRDRCRTWRCTSDRLRDDYRSVLGGSGPTPPRTRVRSSRRVRRTSIAGRAAVGSLHCRWTAAGKGIAMSLKNQEVTYTPSGTRAERKSLRKATTAESLPPEAQTRTADRRSLGAARRPRAPRRRLGEQGTAVTMGTA